MPVNLSVKNVPDDLAESLRQRAARNRRSLQRELLSILESAVRRGPSTMPTIEAHLGDDALTIEQLAEISLRLFPAGTESSVAYVRRLRDSR